MICIINRESGKLYINPEKITSVVNTGERSTGFPVTVYMADGSYFALTEDELEQVHAAWKLRDEQIDNLIEQSNTIIRGLNNLNSTAAHIDSDVHESSGILTQIKNFCSNILSFVQQISNRTT